VSSSDPRAVPPFKVRPARRGDAQGIVTILNEIGATADSATFTWIISHPEVEVLVAADALDKVIGVVTLSHRPLLKVGGRAASIDELGVARGWVRKGVGRELLRRAVERARVLGVKRLEVQTFSAVTGELEAFFRATGFEPTSVGVFRLK
jgi:N-acetylglutamate synthase-like GNAT family acetyltransferase